MFYDFDYYKLDVWVRCRVNEIPREVLPVTVQKQFGSTPYVIPANTDLTTTSVLCIDKNAIRRLSTTGRGAEVWWKAPRLKVLEDVARAGNAIFGLAARLVPDGTVVKRIRGTRDYTVDRTLSALGVPGTTHVMWAVGSGTPLFLPESGTQKQTLHVLPHDGMVQVPTEAALTIVYQYLAENHPCK